MKKIIIYIIIFCHLAVCLYAQNLEKPHWLNSEKPIEKTAILIEDYPYLKQWISDNSQPADEYFFNVCKKHQVIIVGEQHNIKEHKDLINKRISKLYHECGVRVIAWEFSKYSHNSWLDSLVNMPVYDSTAVIEFARAQAGHSWNSKEHWDMIKEVWELNKSLGLNETKMKFIGIDINNEITELLYVLSSQADSTEVYQQTLNKLISRDKIMAANVEKEIVNKGLKGLVFVGRCHDYTHHTLKSDNPMCKYIMGKELHEKYGEKIFQIWLYSGWFEIIEQVLKDTNTELIGFNIFNSPFANILQHTGWQSDKQAPFSNIARGFVYIKSSRKLSKNNVIKGFINQDIFDKYYEFYKLNFGQEFSNPEELDLYLQQNRWEWSEK